MGYEIDRVEDRVAISDMYSRYIFGTDNRDIEELDNYVFLPDSTIDWTSVGHIKVSWQDGGREDYQRNAFSYDFNFHLYANTKVDFVDATTAKAVNKVINTSVKNGEASTVLGEYADVLVKTEKGWRIKSRVWQNSTVICGLQLAEGSGGLLEK